MKFRIWILATLLVFASWNLACTTPSWVAEAESIAKVALPIVEALASILGAGPVVTQVENDISLLIDLLEQYQATPSTGSLQQIQNGLNTVNSDLAQILPAAHITNAATQHKVTAIIQLVTSEFSTIAALVPSSAAQMSLAGKTSAKPPAGPRLPFTAKEFKTQYNRIVKTKTGDPACDAAFVDKELK